MREPQAISIEHLKAYLLEYYNLSTTELVYLPLGLDYSAGVYKAVSEQGVSYLLKISTRPLYEPGCFVPAYLNAQGITAVVAPLPTTQQTFWVTIEGWTMMLYPFHEGETSWTGMTDEQWAQTGSIFKQIHEVVPPTTGFESLRKETFNPKSYSDWIQTFEANHLHEPSEESVARRTLRSSWLENHSTIHAIANSLEKLSNILQKRTLPFVICHADLHPANLLRDHSGHVLVIDWDEVMLAPKERDFVFIKEAPTASETLPGSPAFFQGYGQVDIDWTALTYYRYERVIQDVIACAENVCLKDDLGEGSREAEAQLFQEVLHIHVSSLS